MRRSIFVGHANTFHDGAIAVVEGDRVYAEAFERHTQCKRAYESYRPWYSRRPLKTTLTDLGIWPVRDADVTVVSTWDLGPKFDAAVKGFGGPEQTEKLRTQAEAGWDHVLRNSSDWSQLGGVVAMIVFSARTQPLMTNQLAWLFGGGPPIMPPAPQSMLDDMATSFKTKALEHHLAHAANAVFTSPFSECVVVVVDGYGDGAHASVYHFHDNQFELVHSSTGFSLGLLYARMTFLCGFDYSAGEEWKVMGLAAYGKKRDDLYRFLRETIRVSGLDIQVDMERLDVARLTQLTGGLRKFESDDVLSAADLAHNFQLAFEDAVIELCRNASELGLSKNLCLSGGCALNSSANGKIVPNTSFERLHVPSAPGDDGNALGAALYERHCVRKEPRKPATMSPYLGSAVSREKIEALTKFGRMKCVEFDSSEALCKEVAALLADGNIVGWMQGRAEFGPRALGNRSILADPRSPEMHERINNEVKFRERYRPLAPSVIAEYGPEYFENYQDSPYMDRTLPFRSEVMKRVPAVVHEDGTGRLQSVTPDGNPLYYQLIDEFRRKTGVPMVLNTSLNVMGKPIVHSVEDAVATFYTSGLDKLVIGRHLFSK